MYATAESSSNAKDIGDVIDWLTDTTIGVRTDPSYRQLMTESLRVLGFPDADIKQALDSLYKVN